MSRGNPNTLTAPADLGIGGRINAPGDRRVIGPGWRSAASRSIVTASARSPVAQPVAERSGVAEAPRVPQ